MTTLLLASAYTLVLVSGTCVALTGDPARQAPAMAVFGLVLSVLFVLLGAPDVALSQIAVGSVVTPLLVLLTVRAVARHRERGRERDREPDR